MGKILVVDDEPLVRSLLITILSEYGEVLPASNGVEALAVYMSFRKDIELIVTDLSMPEMGGYEFVNRVRSVDNEVRVIAITGFANEYPDPETTTLIHKPFNVANFRKTVAKVLGRRPSGVECESTSLVWIVS